MGLCSSGIWGSSCWLLARVWLKLSAVGFCHVRFADWVEFEEEDSPGLIFVLTIESSRGLMDWWEGRLLLYFAAQMYSLLVLMRRKG